MRWGGMQNWDPCGARRKSRSGRPPPPNAVPESLIAACIPRSVVHPQRQAVGLGGFRGVKPPPIRNVSTIIELACSILGSLFEDAVSLPLKADSQISQLPAQESHPSLRRPPVGGG